MNYKPISWILMIFLVVTVVVAVKIDKKVETKLDSEDFVRVIVRLNDDNGFSASAKKNMIGKVQGRVLSKIKVKDLNDKFGALSNDDDFRLQYNYELVNTFAGQVSKQGLEKLKNDPDVQSITYDFEAHAMLNGAIPLIGGNETWDLSFGEGLVDEFLNGSGRSVCVIDSGIDTNHEAFGSRIIDEKCFCSRGGACCPDATTEDDSAEDDYGHGTHVAGILASQNETYKGVAPGINLVVVKIIDSTGYTVLSDIMKGVEYCVNMSGGGNPYNISAISMSLGSDDQYEPFCEGLDVSTEDLIGQSFGLGIPVVVASGNDGNATGIAWPACLTNATPVSAATLDGNHFATYANRYENLSLLGPGGNLSGSGTCPDATRICSSWNNGGYSGRSGTSMATPFVSASIAIIKQFIRIQNHSDINVREIENVLFNTGSTVFDSSNPTIDYRLINLYEAIKSLDKVKPRIGFSNTSPVNNSYVTGSIINVTSNEVLRQVLIEINGTTNYTMNGSSKNFWFNITTLSAGKYYSYRVIGNDSAGNLNFTETRIINMFNYFPDVVNITFNCSDNINRTNGSITLAFDVYDENHNSFNYTINWTNNSVELSGLANLTVIGNGNTSKNQNWTVFIKVDDGINQSEWFNATFYVLNALPQRNSTINMTDYNSTNITSVFNETDLINFTFIVYDLDNDTFNVTPTQQHFIPSSIRVNGSGLVTFQWNTTEFDSGNKTITFLLNDTQNVAYVYANLLINDMNDLDNDGINDTIDYLIGNGTNINSTLNLTLFVNGSTNVSKLFNQTYNVTILNNGSVVVRFNWTFNSSNILDLRNITISIQNISSNFGYMIINGIRLFNSTKEFYLDRLSNYSYVCIKDSEDVTYSEISSGCNLSDEFFIKCNNSIQYGYTCNNTGNISLYITGLNNSAVREQCQDIDGDSYGLDCYIGADCDDSDSSKYFNNTCTRTGYTGARYDANCICTGGTAIPAPTTSSSGGGGGGSTGPPPNPNQKIQTWSRLRTGTRTMKINRENIPMQNISFDVVEEATNAKISVTVINTTAPLKNFKGDFYKVTEVNLTNFDSRYFNYADIVFMVNGSWMYDSGLATSDMKLYRYRGWWEELPTTFLYNEGGFSYYQSRTLGFSLFTIGKIFIPTTTTTTHVTTTSISTSSSSTTSVTNTTLLPFSGMNFTSKEIPKEKTGLSMKTIFMLLYVLIGGYMIFYTLLREETTKLRKYNVHKPHNNLSQLKKYIISCMSKGFSDDEIKERLTKVGWKESSIDKILKQGRD